MAYTSALAIRYLKTIGIVNNGSNGRGFANPYDVAFGADDEIFVVNLSTSLALEKLVETMDSSVVRSAVGEINVVNKMNDVNSGLGGEGNGGIILRECHLGRDSLVGATMVLNRMSQSNDTLSSIHSTLPQFEIVKDKVSLEGINPEKLIEKVASAKLPTKYGDFKVYAFKSSVDKSEPIALVKGEIDPNKKVKQILKTV